MVVLDCVIYFGMERCISNIILCILPSRNKWCNPKSHTHLRYMYTELIPLPPSPRPAHHVRPLPQSVSRWLCGTARAWRVRHSYGDGAEDRVPHTTLREVHHYHQRHTARQLWKKVSSLLYPPEAHDNQTILSVLHMIIFMSHICIIVFINNFVYKRKRS